MAAEVKYNPHHAGNTPEARIASRLKNSGQGSNPNVHAVHGDGPTRTHTNIHHSGHYVQAGTAARGQPTPIARKPSDYDGDDAA